MNKISRDKFNSAFSGLTKQQKEILLCFFKHYGKPYKEIAGILGTTERNVISQMRNIYKEFDLQDVNPNCSKHDELLYLFRYYQPDLVKNIQKIRKNIIIDKPQQDLGDIDVAETFYGRVSEIEELQKWIIDENCKLLVLKGIYGVGKTSLAVELAKLIKGKFHFSIGRSLKNSPPLETVLTDIIQFLSNRQIIELPKDLSSLIFMLMEYLQKYRCLLILDNLETILQSGDHTGQYKDEYQGFSELFRKIEKTDNESESCLILTTRELPQEIAIKEGKSSSIRLFQVNCLKLEDAENIIKNKSLSGTEYQFKQLVHMYECHPLMIELIIPLINKVYEGKIADFLKLGLANLERISNILDWHFQRLSDLEKQVIYWIAINRNFVTFEELQDDIRKPINLINSLESLVDRSLISRSAVGFKQHPVMIEYITKRLIEQVCEEIETGKLQLFKSYALIKATANDYVRQTQYQLIIKPIIDNLINVYNNKYALEIRLKQILSQLKEERNIAYAGGNIINILVALQIDLTNYDFSNIQIIQAFLRDVNLYNVNFQNTNFHNSVFKETIAAIFSLAFSPDGKILAISDYRNTIQLMDIQTREKILIINDESVHVFRVLAFSPDGKILASGSTNGTIKLWNLKTRKLLKNLPGHTNWVNSVAFSPDGKILASGSSDSTIKLWEVATGECSITLSEHTDCVHSVAFSSQGILASGSRDKTIKLWKIDKTESLETFTEHEEAVYTVTFSPNSEILASGSGDSTVKLWNIENKRYLTTLKRHNNIVSSVVFSSDGKILASGGYDTNIQLWDIQDVQDNKNINPITTLEGHNNWIRAIAFSPQGEMLASGDAESTIKLWNLQDISNVHCRTPWQGHTSEIRTVAFSPKGNILASGSSDKLVRLWDVNDVNQDVNKDVNNSQPIVTFSGHTDIVYSVAFNSQGTILASGSADCKIKLWNVKTRKCVNLLGHENHVRSVAFSYQSQNLASGSRDCSVKLWDISSEKSEILLQEYTDRIDCIAFHPHQEILSYGIYNGNVKLWDLNNSKYLPSLEGHSKRINSVAFHPEGNILASASSDNTVKLWNILTCECLAILKGHTNLVRSVAFNPEGNILASGSSDGTVRLWDLISYETINILEEHSAWVNSVTFSPCGKILASGSADETIKLWDVKIGACLRTLTISKPYQGMNITGVTGLTEEAKATLKALGAGEFLQSD